MHAVVVQVTISDFEKAPVALEAETIPRVKGAPGFVDGLAGACGWERLSIVLFESEHAARSAYPMVQPGSHPSPFVTVESSEVREVVGHA